MKGRKTLLIITILVLLAVAVPSALAQGGNQQGLWFSGSGTWAIPCGTPDPLNFGSTFGSAMVQANIFVPAGYSEGRTLTFHSAIRGDWTMSETYVEQGDGWNFHGVWFYGMSGDEDVNDTIQVFAPNGLLLTTAQVYASCVTGVIRVTSVDIYGINDPAANQRVMATVLADTPVYPAAALANPTSATLKAGQTWFVVGQVTGADGAVWYEVYVGGPVTGFVPAATLSLSGPVPTSGYHGTSANPAPFPPENLTLPAFF